MRTQTLILAALLVGPSVFSGDVQHSIAPGTYEVDVCPGGCTGDPDVRGYLVLQNQDFDLSSVPVEELEYLLDASGFYLDEKQQPNACFVLDIVNENYETAAGIDRFGFTRWTLTDNVIAVPLYRSAEDAAAVASGVVRWGSIVGGLAEVREIRKLWPHRNDFISAKRVGPVDLSICIEAVRKELEE